MFNGNLIELSRRGGKHCTPQQYEKMLRIIEVQENFNCLCAIRKSGASVNNGKKAFKTAIYQLMANSIGSGWTTKSAKSRFETWFSNFKKVYHMCGDDGEGSTEWGITAADHKKGIHTIEAKKQSMCYGYKRLKVMYENQENIDVLYHEEAATAPRSSRYESTLAPATPEHQPFITNLPDDDQRQLAGGRCSADDSGEMVMNDDIQGTGSQGMQHTEEQDSDGSDDDDEEEEYASSQMPKRRVTVAYGAQAAKRCKIEARRIALDEDKLKLARERLDMQRTVRMRRADLYALKIKLDFIQNILINGYTADEALQLWDRVSGP